MENSLHLLYGLMELRKQILAGKDVGDLGVVEFQIKQLTTELSQFVMEAVVKKDDATVEEFARAVATIKRFKPKRDALKQKILYHKYILDKIGESRDIHQWAMTLEYKDATDKENGYPHLRRQLKSLKAPLRPISQIERPTVSKSLE